MKRVGNLVGQILVAAPVAGSGENPPASVEEKVKNGGLLLVEHLNVNILSNDLATEFYGALGCSRNEQMLAVRPMLHANVGVMCQFHLPSPAIPSGKEILEEGEGAQVWRGEIEVLYANAAELQNSVDRLGKLQGKAGFEKLKCTAGEAGTTKVVGPYGNRFLLRVCSPDKVGAWTEKNGLMPNMRPLPENLEAMKKDPMGRGSGVPPSPRPTCLGLGDISVEVPIGAAAGIGRFYRDYFNFEVQEFGPGICAVVGGPENAQRILFKDTAGASATPGTKSGEHICMYVGNLDGVFTKLKQNPGKDLIWQNPRFKMLDWVDTIEDCRRDKALRFRDIVDPLDPEKVIFQLEHEVRAMDNIRCPLYNPMEGKYMGA